MKRPIQILGVAVATAALTAATAPALAVPATGVGLVTRCSGEAAGVTVPGELVVPAGASCVLDDVVVQGRVRVAAGADLIVSDSALHGDVVLASDAYLDAVGVSIDGRVTNRDGYGVYLEGGTLGSYLAPAVAGPTSFLTAVGTAVEGTIRADGGEVLLESTSVAGDVRATGVAFADVVDATVLGHIQVSGAANGSALCGSEVDGDATYTGNAGVQIGVGELLVSCEDSVYIGGDLTIDDSGTGVIVADAIVRGDLAGAGNDPAPVLADVRVRGESAGQFADAAPTVAPFAVPAETTVERGLDERAQDRRGAALAAAAAAGDAGL